MATQRFFNVHPYLPGEMIQFDEYFLDGLKPPTIVGGISPFWDPADFFRRKLFSFKEWIIFVLDMCEHVQIHLVVGWILFVLDSWNPL